ncbi:hypothetical protein M404DRAFT_732386 [Pisolithus tinctorius Marx 270]|uniref:Uncharacterized protein n=1 Tax=Pisolithus tinctorius Marx 270 TaxID=870435 RepID=A0A0C3P273_PISTI|nr:hypothetical protein M404DRAFT_732386 [Pisolithus tinctorius Marx 270]
MTLATSTISSTDCVDVPSSLKTPSNSSISSLPNTSLWPSVLTGVDELATRINRARTSHRHHNAAAATMSSGPSISGSCCSLSRCRFLCFFLLLSSSCWGATPCHSPRLCRMHSQAISHPSFPTLSHMTPGF